MNRDDRQAAREQLLVALEQGQSWTAVCQAGEPPVCRATFYNLRRRMHLNPTEARRDHRRGPAYKAPRPVQE